MGTHPQLRFPLALSVAVEKGQIVKNNLILTEAIGGGLAWGAVV